MKKLFLILVLVSILALQGCNKSNVTSTGSIVSNPNNLYFSNAQFKLLADDMGKKLKIDGFNFIENNWGYMILDKDITFNKRSFLTVDGNQSDDLTQTRLTFSNSKHDEFIQINLIYLNKELENDLAYINGQNPDKFASKDIFKNFDESLLAFHNLLVKVTHVKENSKSVTNPKWKQSPVIEISRLLVKFLNDYKKS